MGIKRILSDDLGMKVTGEEDQLGKLRAGEIPVALTVGIETIPVIQEKDGMTAIPRSLTVDQSVKKQVPGDTMMTGKMTWQKSRIPLVVFLLQLFEELVKELRPRKRR